MKVLSLFDGISCGMVALEREGFPVERYAAYEIEESAIKISKHHYPMIEQCGDVFKADFTKYQGFDLLIGGSPCTFWSVARKDRETTSDGFGFELFKQYVRALKESGCKYFLYENNYSMHKDIRAEITKYLGVEPIMINSELVSAQQRKRLYWTNIQGVQQPEDKGIMLQDIIESGMVDRKKSLCIARRTVGNQGSQSYMRRRYFGKSFAQMVFEGCTPQEQKDLWKQDPEKEFETDGFIRPLTILEMERLQTLDDNYTKVEGVTDTQRGEAIGNGWTVDVIAHILSYIKNEEKEKKEMEMKVTEYQLPEQILFNYEELKQELSEKVHLYETLVYTDDQIKDAKDDRAKLNKLKKALNDERIRREKEYMVPFNDFKQKVTELIGIIDKASSTVDLQVKKFEDKKKQEKMDAITALFNETDHPEWLHLSQIFSDTWLNSYSKINAIREEIEAKLKRITTEIETLSNLPEFGFEATEVYKSTLDINRAIAEGHRLSEIAKKKAEAERIKAEAEAKKARLEAEAEFAQAMNPPVEEQKKEATISKMEQVQEPAKQWISFQALLSTEDALALKDFFNSRQIEFKAI